MPHCLKQNIVLWKKTQTNKQTNKNNIKQHKNKKHCQCLRNSATIHVILIITYVILCYNDKNVAFNKVKK